MLLFLKEKISKVLSLKVIFSLHSVVTKKDITDKDSLP
jgi:hypothetical protein